MKGELTPRDEAVVRQRMDNEGVARQIGEATLEDVRAALTLVEAEATRPQPFWRSIFPTRGQRERERGEAGVIRAMMAQRIAAIETLGTCKHRYLEQAMTEWLLVGAAARSVSIDTAVREAAATVAEHFQQSSMRVAASVSMYVKQVEELDDAVRDIAYASLVDSYQSFLQHVTETKEALQRQLRAAIT